jgi:plastocyanin
MRLVILASLLMAAPAVAQPKKDPPKPVVAGRTVKGTVKVLEADGKTEVSNVEVVVWVVGPPEQPGQPVIGATITQTNDRKFVPDLVAITTNEKVVFPNGGKLLHNVFSPKPKFDLGSFDKGEKKDSGDAFKGYKGTAEIYCNIHPEMAATVVVLPNPYHVSLDQKTKSFEIKNVPPGKWKLYAYTRRAEKPASVDFDITAGDAAVPEIKITRSAETKHLNKYGEKYKDGRSYP